MKIAVFTSNNTYIASVVEDNGDEFELTRASNKDELLDEIKNMGHGDVDIEFMGN